jgi:hypothetical protein
MDQDDEPRPSKPHWHLVLPDGRWNRSCPFRRARRRLTSRTVRLLALVLPSARTSRATARCTRSSLICSSKGTAISLLQRRPCHDLPPRPILYDER